MRRVVRVSVSSAGQSNRLYGVEPPAPEDAARGDNPDGVCAVRDFLYAAAAQARLFVGGSMPACGCVLCVSVPLTR